MKSYSILHLHPGDQILGCFTTATCHMTFRKKNEDLNDITYGVVYVGYMSDLKPKGNGTINVLKLPRFPDFLLQNVLYLPMLHRNLLSLVHIQHQGHSIHMFYGKVDIRISSDN